MAIVSGRATAAALVLVTAIFGATPGVYADGDGGMTTFTEPTQHAFTISVPDGWTVNAAPAPFWLSASSPDRSTTLFIGDPSIPSFEDVRVAPGLPPPVLPANTVEAPYENGQQFAADYGQRTASRVCTDVQVEGTRPEPDRAQAMSAKFATMGQQLGSTMPLPAMDGGTAIIGCTVNGTPYVVEITAVTSLLRMQIQAMESDSWQVAMIMGFGTPAPDQASAENLLQTVSTSIQWDQNWQAQQLQAMRQAVANNNQQAQAASNALSGLAASESAALHNQYVGSTQALEAGHQAFMAGQAAAQAGRDAGFAQHMFDKGVGQQREMMYINNQTCIKYWGDNPANGCRVYAQQ